MVVRAKSREESSTVQKKVVIPYVRYYAERNGSELLTVVQINIPPVTKQILIEF